MKHVTGKSKFSPIPDLFSTELVPGSPEMSRQSKFITNIDKANALNKFFAQQTHLDDDGREVPPVSFPSSSPSEEFSTLHTSPSEIYDILRNLKPGKAPGKDGLPPDLVLRSWHRF